ncbi:MAG: hypothetical protein WAK20_05205 [Candidatus Acidiferrum sp.]
MKRILLILPVATAIFLAACGGGSNITPPPPAGTFSDASLKGQYAFSMSGIDTNGAYIARVGSFVADGNGSITAGLEDLVQGSSGASEITFSGGSYTIQSNGRGLLVFTNTNGGGLQLNIALLSTSQGVMVQTDLNDSTSGGFALQTPSEFSVNALKGNYVFDFSGISFSGTNAAPLSVVGEVTLDGTGNVTSGVLDSNDGTVSAAQAIPLGTYQMDSTGNGTNFGRGTMNFANSTYAFYIVDNSRVKIIEEDSSAATEGDATLQSSNVPTQNSGFNGSFVYLVGGSSLVANGGALAQVARFTSDGNGGVTAISLDQNNDGNTTHISQGNNITNANYVIDSAHAGTGRGTLSFKDSNLGQINYVFYLVSPAEAVIQNISVNVVADGLMQSQSGSSFTNASVAGNYVFNWTGIQIGSQTFVPLAENFVGLYTLSSAASNNLTGVMDYTEMGTTGSTLYSDIGLAGHLSVNSDGTANNTFQVVGGSPSSTTFNFVAYVVSPNTTYVLCTDSTRITSGIATIQTVP